MAKTKKAIYYDLSASGRLNEDLDKLTSSLKLGDVVRMKDDLRQLDSYIVTIDNKLIKNPDNSGSGYLTIPIEITKHLADACSYYKNMIKTLDVEFGDIELSLDDTTVRKIFKEPSTILQNAYIFYSPYMDQIIVQVGRKTQEFHMSSVTQEEIELAFAKKPSPHPKKNLLAAVKALFGRNKSKPLK
jgi:hypothetical protein